MSTTVTTSLTPRQEEILLFIKQHVAKQGYPPTVRDIGQAVGLTSSSTVHAHLSNLVKAGLIRRDPTKPRAIELLDRELSVDVADAQDQQLATVTELRPRQPVGLPLVGQVAAGGPILAEENVEEYVTVPEIGGGDNADFVLRVRGDSMEGAGILDGDFVVVRSQQVARDGEIVIALIEDEATCKRYYREHDHIRLESENPAYEPIRSSDASVIGSVVGVFRRVA